MTVHERADLILVNASKDESGQILTKRTGTGWCIQASDWKEDRLKGREEEAWRESLRRLEQGGYIYLFNQDRDWIIYKLTSRGWDKSDDIKQGGGTGRLNPVNRQLLDKINKPPSDIV